MGLGLSRDDAGKFLPAYVQQGILPKDPFVSIDVEGVGEMVRIATAKGRATKPGLKLGICGEHGGDPASIRFCAEARRMRPDIAFGADLIAGFPTETEALFDETVEIVDSCGLAFLHVFPYSPRRGTPPPPWPPRCCAVAVGVPSTRASARKEAAQSDLAAM